MKSIANIIVDSLMEMKINARFDTGLFRVCESFVRKVCGIISKAG